MKEALYYKKLDRNITKCELCPRFCIIKPGERGLCGVRQNIKGKLFSLVYNRPCAMHTDPIEKKPLYHFMPGAKAFSIATIGCNFFCGFCQNWQISRADANNIEKHYAEVRPEKVVELCKEKNCGIISYTYTEPTIFYEYMLDIARLATEQNIKNTIVSNGYINEKPLRELCKVLDGANIDLKAFTNEFYKEVCKGTLEPVLRSLRILKEEGVWLELTNLVVPGLNDDFDKIEEMCKWIAKELGRDVPLHFSRFHPDYVMTEGEPTPLESLEKAKGIAEKYLDYVYLGNIGGESNTLCPRCGAVVIRRGVFGLVDNKLVQGKCPECDEKIAGVFL
ncbi:MAG TPA: AmmeMemoRadiSam system radical SAM enzyme [Candidatus Woesearchaeota archaeon]|nr:AmmeMemoRadiSam system radical SAM enzyme [Candidatus Woesearchaeota archaeon]